MDADCEKAAISIISALRGCDDYEMCQGINRGDCLCGKTAREILAKTTECHAWREKYHERAKLFQEIAHKDARKIAELTAEIAELKSKFGANVPETTPSNASNGPQQKQSLDS